MIALGSHVTFTHRAAVARRRPPEGQWDLTEPKKHPSTSYRGDTTIVMTSVTPITYVDAIELAEKPKAHFGQASSDERWEKRNKTILAWPQEGSGVVVGQVRRQFGTSYEGRTSFSGDDWDPGYFIAMGQLNLYVVKSELRGPEVYVPEQFIHLVHGGSQ